MGTPEGNDSTGGAGKEAAEDAESHNRDAETQDQGAEPQKTNE